MQPKPAFKWIMRFVAVLVIICALGQIANWHPFGVGAMIRSGLSVVGIVGAILLLCGRRLAWPILIAWGAVQTVVWITDPSGSWFNQSLVMEYKSHSWHSMGNQITGRSGKGVNVIGLIWVAIFLAMLFVKWFPRLKPMPKPNRLMRGVIIATMLLAVMIPAAWYVQHLRAARAAMLIITTDIPLTRVYYKDRFLGRTPLIVTPERLKEWNLPFGASDTLEMGTSSWTQRPVLYVKGEYKRRATLDFQAPPFAPSPRVLPTHWGVRHAVLNYGMHGNRQNFILWYGNHDVAPWLHVEVVTKGPYQPSQIIQITCTLTNPEKKTHRGVSPRIEAKFFPFEKLKTLENGMLPRQLNQTFDMTDDWKTWPPNSSRTVTLDVQLPEEPGHYTLMATHSLLIDDHSNRLVFGSPHSNYHLIEIIAPQQKVVASQP